MGHASGSSDSYVVCMDSDGYAASLEKHKIYRTVPDEEAAADGDVRIIDESGEDYLYPAHRFVPIDVPAVLEKALTVLPTHQS